MISLPPGELFMLSQIDELFANLEINREVHNNNDGYISSSAYRRLTGKHCEKLNEIDVLNKNKQEKRSEQFVDKRGTYDFNLKDTILDITPLLFPERKK
jgi:hypothetical protein